MKQAVVILFPMKEWSETLYYAISRPNNSDMWGLPGGKVEEGETLAQAIVREVKEEMNITISESDINPIFTMVCDGEVPYESTTFEYTGPKLPVRQIEPEEGLSIGLCLEEELCDPDFSPFHEYNTKLFASIA